MDKPAHTRQTRCRRCDWSGDDPAEHSEAAGHPLCCRGQHFLAVGEEQTCARCTALVRVALYEIVKTYPLLPPELVHHANEKIPGGDALVMLAGGSSSGSGDPDAVASDPESVAATLGRWEDAWRSWFRWPVAQNEPDVGPTVFFLTRHLDRAAAHHPAFADFAADVHRLVVRIGLVTATVDFPVRAPVRCFDCDAERLERAYGKDGLSEDWQCRGCGRVYDQASYWLALRAKLEEALA